MSKQNSWLFTPTCSFPVFFVGNGISISPFLRLKSKSESHSVMSDSLKPYQLYSSWNFSCQNTGVGSLSLLQGILPTQGLNPGLLHCRQNLYQLSHQGSPRILEWVGYPFSRGSSQPRNQTGVSCIAGGFFTNWAIRKVLLGGKWGEILDSSSLTPYTWFSLCSGNYMFKICVYFIFSLHLHC